MQLLVSSPWWFILFCIIAGASYSYLLYRPKWENPWYKLLAAIRFITVSLISFFLLSPVVTRISSTFQKPVVLMVMDNSQSITAGKDSAFYKNQFLKNWKNARVELGNDYDVQYLTIGNSITIGDTVRFNEKRTNIGQLFDYVNNTYAKQNVGAVVLASDGIYNRGTNPVYKKLDNQPSLFTIGLGDSSIKKDLILKTLDMNTIAYQGNDFPIDINMTAYASIDNRFVATLTIDGAVVASQAININKDDYSGSIHFMAHADKPGTKHIVVTLSTIEGEVSKINNRKDAFIEVIDGREKILFIYNSPHPDIGSLKNAISANSNYELLAKPAGEVKLAEINTFSVVILHQLPSRTNQAKDILSTCRSANIPVWCIVGAQTSIDLLPAVASSAKISNHQGRTNESQAAYNTDFNTFILGDETKRTLVNLPPLKVPFGNYSATNFTEVLAYQRIGEVTTKLPLWTFQNQNGEKTAFLFGEGFWGWRIVDFSINGNHLATDELVSKTVQYLATKDDKRKFRAYPGKQIYEEDESIKFFAELYNDNYELVNQVDVKIELTDRGSRLYKYNFSPIGKSYHLELGNMPAGIYKYKAYAMGVSDIVTGQLLITPLQTELVNTRADFALLRQLAKNNNGQFETAEGLKNIISGIRNNPDITTNSYIEKKTDELIQIKLLFFLILTLLTFEWLVRKYEGGY